MGTQPANVLQQDILEECLPLVHNMICKVAWQTQRKYGGDFEQWLSECYYIFCTSIDSHSDNLATINTWLYRKLHWGLIDKIRKDMSKKSKMQLYNDCPPENQTEEDSDVSELIENAKQNNFYILIDHVDETTKELWQLIINPPEELQGDIDIRQPECTEDALVHYCKYKLHWTTRQIASSFDELMECLND